MSSSFTFPPYLFPLFGSLLAAGEMRGHEFTPQQLEFYSSTVKPILTEHCYQCHGGGDTDKEGNVKVKSGLQIISRDGLIKGGEHGAAVDLQAPEKSLLLTVVSYADEHLKMPPRGKLADEEISALEQWIKQGLPVTPDDLHKAVVARPELHKEKGPDVQWTYEPIKPVTAPTGAGFPAHPVDALLTQNLQAKGLAFSPPASKAALIRRATYDLTGLPPSPEEVATFVSDADPAAYEKLLDKLLASQHYGEKYGRHWLDLVRYADSNGFERDNFKAHMWRYRQWVLDSLNADKPYDAFLREQLAGDELDQPTPDSLAATGYWRLMQWDDEPADRIQANYDVMDDNVRVTAETFLGMSIGCARCHNHKTDPILQKDYYSFMAFIHGLSNFSNSDSIRNLNNQHAKVTSTTDQRGNILRSFPTQLSSQRQQMENRLSQLLMKLQPLFLEAVPEKVGNSGKLLVPTGETAQQAWDITETKPADDWAMPGYAVAPTTWRSAIGGFGDKGTAGAKTGHHTDWKTPDLWMRTYFQLTEIPKSLTLLVHHDDDAEVYLNGKLVKVLEDHTNAYVRIPIGPEGLEALQTGKNVLAIHTQYKVGGRYVDAGLEYGWEPVREYARSKGKTLLTPEDTKQLDGLEQRMAQFDRKQNRTNDSDELLAQIAYENGPQPAKLSIHIRGNAHSEGAPVEPAFPVVFNSPAPKISPLEKSSGRRRALAEWIADPQNPRTSRVIVNRLWQWHFGRGLNASANEFGKQGSGVTNPALLDWLATELIKQGWSLKKMHKLLMTSQAYTQAAVLEKSTYHKGASVDPANQLWWHFDQRRLTSEELRDSLLSVSGTLNPAYGGESFFVEMPAEVLQTSSTGGRSWKQSDPADQRRRSVYMISKRSLQYPLLTDFDQADTENPCPSRFTTTVPTQALNMLNSQAIQQQAVLLAKRLIAEKPGDLAAQITRGLELVTQLPAEPTTVQNLVETEGKLRSQHGLNTDQARERLCLILLNLNQFLYLD